MSKSIIEIAIEILENTHDGNDLVPEHLKMVEHAVNGNLNELGEVEFYRLHADVLKGYVKPYLHGVKNLTIDHEGYIYWKSHEIEHFNFSYAYSDRSKPYCLELRRRCEKLEGLNKPINTHTVVWQWED